MKGSRLWNNPEQTHFRIHHTRNNERVTSLEQSGTDAFPDTSGRNNKRVIPVTGSGCHLPCASGHETSRLDGPGHRRRCPRMLRWNAPGRPREKLVIHSLGSGTGAEALEPPPPEESGEGLWPGFGLRWSVDLHRLLVAAPRRDGAEGTAPLRASSPPPVVVTDTIRIPWASAAAPDFPPLATLAFRSNSTHHQN